MKKTIFILVILITVNVYGDFNDFYWSINYGAFEAGLPWYAIDGEWNFYKTIQFKDGLILNRKNETIGNYWFAHPTNLIIKIDAYEWRFYGSINFKENSTIMCGTGELWAGHDINVIKIVMVRDGKTT